jgi:heme-degrading monooxygenase HmoA
MILEAAILNVRSGQDAAFAATMAKARPLIAATPGFLGIEVRPCLEHSGRYILLVWWERLEDHTHGFRCSERYQEWKELLHHFYDPFPQVEHFGASIV